MITDVPPPLPHKKTGADSSGGEASCPATPLHALSRGFSATARGLKSNAPEPENSGRPDGATFQETLTEAGNTAVPPSDPPRFSLLPPDVLGALRETEPPSPVSTTAAAADYNRLSAWEQYKDDQLLSNPGGDAYGLKRQTHDAEAGPTDFLHRVGKDLSDAWENFKNFFKDLFFGAERCYRDGNNQIRTASKRGVLGSVVDFCKDMGSALSFGAWRPDGEPAPEGFGASLKFAWAKAGEALFGDLFRGVPGAAIHMAEDLALSAWNLAETVPDATIGNSAAGEKLTSDIFDTGQVAMDYLTDILPGGEAWVRVHASRWTPLDEAQPPVAYNLRAPERQKVDDRWRYVRNTPLRKTIETAGALLSDVFAVKLALSARSGSGHRTRLHEEAPPARADMFRVLEATSKTFPPDIL